LRVRTGAQNRKSGDGIEDNTYFSWAVGSWSQHNASTFDFCVEWVSGAEAKFAADRKGKNDLTFGGKLGFHGKTILP
jgi:hypothetical protein